MIAECLAIVMGAYWSRPTRPLSIYCSTHTVWWACPWAFLALGSPVTQDLCGGQFRGNFVNLRSNSN